MDFSWHDMKLDLCEGLVKVMSKVLVGVFSILDHSLFVHLGQHHELMMRTCNLGTESSWTKRGMFGVDIVYIHTCNTKQCKSVCPYSVAEPSSFKRDIALLILSTWLQSMNVLLQRASVFLSRPPKSALKVPSVFVKCVVPFVFLCSSLLSPVQPRAVWEGNLLRHARIVHLSKRGEDCVLIGGLGIGSNVFVNVRTLPLLSCNAIAATVWW